MKRSVILMGGKTYVLSLPSQWIKKYSIQKGEELDLEEKENALIVRTEKRPEGAEVEVDFSQLDMMLGRALGALYKAGYTRAKVRYRTQEQLQKLDETLQRTLIGFAITKQEKEYVIIDSLAEIKAGEFDTSLKRLFYSLEIMGEELVRALAARDVQALEKVIEKDGQINRLADFCRRVINSGQTQFLRRSAVLYYIVEQLERIGDAYKGIAALALKTPLVLSPVTEAFFREIRTLFVQYRTLFYKFDFEGFEHFGKMFLRLRRDFEDALQKVSTKDQVFWFHQSALLELIGDMNGALLTFHV